MSNQGNRNNFLMGAAAAVGVIGTLASLLMSKKTKKGWIEQAKETANQMAEEWSARSYTKEKNIFLGGLAGSLVGVTTALLLAPKAGYDLIKDLSDSFQKVADYAVEGADQSVKHAKKARTAVTKQRAAASSRIAKKVAAAKKAPAVKKLSKAVSKAKTKIQAEKKTRVAKKHAVDKTHAHHNHSGHGAHSTTNHHHAEKAD